MPDLIPSSILGVGRVWTEMLYSFVGLNSCTSGFVCVCVGGWVGGWVGVRLDGSNAICVCGWMVLRPFLAPTNPHSHVRSTATVLEQS